MFQKIMVGPRGRSFLKDVKRSGRSIFVWTVNDENWMKWSIQKRVDGVITDDPRKYLKLCEKYEDGDKQVHISMFDGGMLILFNILAIFFGWLMRYRFSSKSNKKAIKKAAEDLSKTPAP